jgi:hypothetical protein
MQRSLSGLLSSWFMLKTMVSSTWPVNCLSTVSNSLLTPDPSAAHAGDAVEQWLLPGRVVSGLDFYP